MAAEGVFMMNMYHLLELVRICLFISVATIAFTGFRDGAGARAGIAVCAALVPLIKSYRDKWKLLERGIQCWGYAGALVKHMECILDGHLQQNGAGLQQGTKQAQLVALPEVVNFDLIAALDSVMQKARQPSRNSLQLCSYESIQQYRAKFVAETQAALVVVEDVLLPEVFKASFL
jgi:hypothetical protein